MGITANTQLNMLQIPSCPTGSTKKFLYTVDTLSNMNAPNIGIVRNTGVFVLLSLIPTLVPILMYFSPVGQRMKHMLCMKKADIWSQAKLVRLQPEALALLS